MKKDAPFRDRSELQMVEYGTRMRKERDEAREILSDLVTAYDACFDPDASPGTADRLGDALNTARAHLGVEVSA